ncbi:MAG TPA: DoxX family protein [Candidatus Saccharimonadales bacterium]|jgi:putative oxidoreductase|nr:DoxX family protein [Candidatus Saccharimonadales bacterium]
METKNSFFRRCYGLLVRGAEFLQSPLLLALRLYWGWQFFLTGRGKLQHLDKTAEFFQSLHIPFPHFSACLAGGTECFGGLFLLAGLGSRLVSLPLIFITVIAYLTAESDSLKQIFSDPDKFVTATPFLFMLACIIVLAFGPGVLSLDWLIEKAVCKKSRGAA